MYSMINFAEYVKFTPGEFSIVDNCEMSLDDYDFLHNIFCKVKPKKVVEIGVSAGGTTVFLRSLMEKYGGESLYSFDYNTQYYRNPVLEVGYMAHGSKSNIEWYLFTGGMPCRYFSHLCMDIDICIIDTAHRNPGEHINILEILPYMRKGGIIVLHDTALYLLNDDAKNCWTNRVALNTLRGKQLFPRVPFHEVKGMIPNIGGVVLGDVEEMLFPLFTNLTLPWNYLLNFQDFHDLCAHFLRFYDAKLVDIFIYTYQFYKKKYMQGLRQRVAEGLRHCKCEGKGVKTRMMPQS